MCVCIYMYMCILKGVGPQRDLYLFRHPECNVYCQMKEDWQSEVNHEGSDLNLHFAF